MPFANEHSAMITDKKYKKYRRIEDKFGKGIDVIFGIKDKEGPNGGRTELHSIRFKKSDWTPEKAKKWLKNNNFEVKEWVEALNEESSASITSSTIGDAYNAQFKVFDDAIRRDAAITAKINKERSKATFLEHMENYVKDHNKVKNDMIEYLKTRYEGDTDIQKDNLYLIIDSAIYNLCRDYHSGQFSVGYKILSSYKNQETLYRMWKYEPKVRSMYDSLTDGNFHNII